MDTRRLAIVTGASSGIGAELARLAAEDGHDLLIVANEPAIHDVARDLSATGARVEAVEADLMDEAGVDALLAHLGARTPALLFANAGTGLGDGFIDQHREGILRVIGTNVTGTILLAHEIAIRMAAAGEGRILFTGSIAGFVPGPYHALYNASKAFIDSFAIALRHELSEAGVSVTCLMPGPVETRFFDRVGLRDTVAGQGPKYTPDKVAKDGYAALMAGDEQVLSGFATKITAALAHVTPARILAEQHKKMFKPIE
jgi:uncharacterized protein